MQTNSNKINENDTRVGKKWQVSQKKITKNLEEYVT